MDIYPVKNNNSCEVKWRRDKYGEVSIFHFRRCYDFILLNQSAGLVWALADGSRKISDISRELYNFYGILTESGWYRQARRTILKLAKLNLLNFSGQKIEEPAAINESPACKNNDKEFCYPLVTVLSESGFMLARGSRPDLPLQAYLILTHECNLRCKHCYERTHTDSVLLCTEDAKKAIDLLKDAGVFCLGLTGGEPFLRKDIYDIIDYAVSKDFYVRVNTNGTLLDGEAVVRLKKYKGKLSLYIGLDGGSARVHDFNRGDNNFQLTVSNMERLLKEGLDVFADYTINRQNYRDLFKAYLLCNRMGVNAMNISEFGVLGFGERNKDKLALSAVSYRLCLYSLKLKLFFAKIIRKEKISCRLITFFNDRCPAGTLYFAVDPAGDTFICELMGDSFGNIFRSPPGELWHSRQLLPLLDANNFKKPCSICFFRYTCNGKCRAHVAEMTGDLFSGNPACMRGKLFNLMHSVYITRKIMDFFNSIIDRHYRKMITKYAPYKEKELLRSNNGSTRAQINP